MASEFKTIKVKSKAKQRTKQSKMISDADKISKTQEFIIKT